MKNNSKKSLAAILGLIVADALGVPVEFKSRAEMKMDPVAEMRGYGTHYQPAGTWSDDSSMTIATMEWLSEIKDRQPDYGLLMEKFSNWLMHGEYTPYGRVFDCGIATSKAISRYANGTEPLQCGGKSERDNGNGSLMRILPVALWCGEELANAEIKNAEIENAEIVYNVSALTHGHLRSKIGCLIYSKLIADIISAPDKDKLNAVEKSLSACKKYFDSLGEEETAAEIENYSRLWDIQAFQNLEEDVIKSSGYVVDTLEAAVWCFLNTDNYTDCVLKAVNLGEDTDTVGAVAGGLAGAYYGLAEIPKEWIDILPKKEWIIELAEKMI